MKMKSKPLPPLRSLEKREEEEEEEEEIEMRELVASTEEDKDDYYFEDPSNISKHHSLWLHVFTFLQCLFSDSSL